MLFQKIYNKQNIQDGFGLNYLCKDFHQGDNENEYRSINVNIDVKHPLKLWNLQGELIFK